MPAIDRFFSRAHFGIHAAAAMAVGVLAGCSGGQAETDAPASRLLAKSGATTGTATGTTTASSAPLQSLKSIPVPGPTATQLGEFVANKNAALALGKALFWDMKVGSDNKTACASCHYQAGADNRITNQLNPGLLSGDSSFALGGVNYTLQANDFPLLQSINDVASSQGVFNSTFASSGTNGGIDTCSSEADPVFHGSTGNTRRVAPRNSPSVINAVYNFRNFWDGRANNVFNGGDPFGMRNEAFYVMKWDKGQFVRSTVRLPSSSLASQASGPPLSGVEMSCKGRDFINLAQKLLEQPILSGQTIAVDDSVLGSYAKNRPTYAALIRSAFNSAYWTASVPVRFERGMLPKIESMDLVDRPTLRTRPAPTDLTQMQANFSLFFGLALQLYESTLVANDTPYDRHAEGRSSLTEQQLRGLQVFNGQGRCVSCHGGPEFTNASVRNVLTRRIESMTMGDGGMASYDSGFYNIGVRPTSEDAGVGGSDPFNKPFSETGMAQLGLTGQLGNDFNSAVEAAVTGSSRLATAGAFKVPGLRNVELTGPYFHNGGKATLMQVVNFYDRGGDFADSNRATLAPDIQPLGLSSTQKEDLVAFLLSLTDERVRLQRAPFDHPSLCLPHGQGGAVSGGVMGDTMECLPDVGAGGVAAAAGLKPFLGLSPFSSPEQIGSTASATTP